MKINEMYSAIEGEGIWQGYLSYFIRFSGCNLKCSFCDTQHKNCIDIDIFEITEKVENYFKNKKNKKIVITGGEPFLQNEELEKLIEKLLVNECEICIYTNGTLIISDDIIKNKNIHIILDYKFEYQKLMQEENLINMSEKDVLKFVIDNTDKINDVIRIIENINSKIIITPSYQLINPIKLADKIIKLKLDNVKLGLQQHKYIYPPNMKGV